MHYAEIKYNLRSIKVNKLKFCCKFLICFVNPLEGNKWQVELTKLIWYFCSEYLRNEMVSYDKMGFWKCWTQDLIGFVSCRIRSHGWQCIFTKYIQCNLDSQAQSRLSDTHHSIHRCCTPELSQTLHALSWTYSFAHALLDVLSFFYLPSESYLTPKGHLQVF